MCCLWNPKRLFRHCASVFVIGDSKWSNLTFMVCAMHVQINIFFVHQYSTSILLRVNCLNPSSLQHCPTQCSLSYPHHSNAWIITPVTVFPPIYPGISLSHYQRNAKELSCYFLLHILLRIGFSMTARQQVNQSLIYLFAPSLETVSVAMLSVHII